MAKYDLSVAIIFKNEIRCLERCLKSLQPLRERLSVQIVMADTGSNDGSRAVAERYADVLFDFPWINDFAAARNAVLDRCRGRWTLVVDCDEWLDGEGAGELSDFIKSTSAKKNDAAMLAIRNYSTANFDRYTEFNAIRLLNMATGVRYAGAIHEQPDFHYAINCRVLTHTKLHHDGYVMLNDNSEAGKIKIERNLQLLKKERERSPDDLRTLSLYLDSAGAEPDYLGALRHAVKLVEEKQPKYERYGAPLFRTAIAYAYNEKLSELGEWGKTAAEMFPRSYFTRLDTNYVMLLYAHDEKNYKRVVDYGLDYLKAYDELNSDPNGWLELRFGVLQRRGERWYAIVCCCIADAYYHLSEYEQAISMIKRVPWEGLDAAGVRGTLKLLKSLHVSGKTETADALKDFWHGILTEKPTKAVAAERTEEFLNVGGQLLRNEAPTGSSSSWTLFLPLRGKCVLGDYAALASAQTPEEADALLAGMDHLAELPAPAFVHALRIGAEFPLPAQSFPMELADVMANKLSTDAAFLREAAIYAAEAFETDVDLNWGRALALAALQGNDWAADADPMPLLRAFVRVESAFLARCYTGRALQYPGYLPPLHRFALHLANAFAALSPAAVSPEFTPSVTGGVRGALAELKEAAIAAPEQKQAVDAVLNSLLRQ